METTEKQGDLLDKEKRLLHYDILRILAAYLIVMLHLSVQYINKAPDSVEGYLQWQQAVKFSAASRVGVPLFVMLSGAFLLHSDKEVSLSAIFKKYLPKLIIIFVCWSFFYSLAEQNFFYHVPQWGFSRSWQAVEWKVFWPYFIQGHYHMWYLYMLAGLYLITPLLKHIAAQASRTQLIYFVLMCVLVTAVTKMNEVLWHLKIVDMFLEKLSLGFFLGYIGYFLAGFLFRQHRFGWKLSLVVFALALEAFRFTYQETWRMNPMFGFREPSLIYFSNYSPTIFFMSFGVFLLFAKLDFLKPPKPIQQGIACLPQYLLTVYLLHPFIIDWCRRLDWLFPTVQANSLPINGVIVFAVSLGVSIILVQLYRLPVRLIRLVFRTPKC
ncbi:acyltransferase family protein [Aminipila butyrica]|uniref:Acyltransferase family protein n=1 Tax=Aminipila butyrica TaxID=433296 RepID=A0A858BT72_9FIRM|nr:acyltransferase family protein [Aminipila butyrica]QIB68140.1 acyltransferase family protein [Aminipila butyrica]